MQNEDASHTGSMGHAEPIARADVDTLPPGSFGPATGNAITGAGTTTGASGADSVAAGPATIVEVRGAGGEASQTAGHFQATGQYGVLTMDAQGDFNYVRNPGTPDGVKDVFNYTLADATGANASTTLTIDIGQVAAAAAGQGVVALPAGVELSDIHVNGRDLVINLPDGTQMVIPEGAVFVPQLAIGDVQVPATNLAALLIDSEPQPAAGPPLSSGGNFADPVPPLDPGVPLGDLIPPTELSYTPPDFRPIGQFEDTKPTVVIEPHDLAPGAIDAVDQVNEKGLPARDGNLANEPAGSGEIADGNGTNNSDASETTNGSIVFSAQDGLQSITIDGADGVANAISITNASVGTTIQGQFGTLTITSVDLANGTVGYTYTLADNTSGDTTADHFTVVVTDSDGDTATATLTVDIIDDVPTARSDTDAITGADQSTDGNVMTGVGTTSGSVGADTVGADNATVTGVHPGTSGGFSSVPQDGSGVTIHGTFGDLVLHDDGSYTYTRTDAHQGGTDVFTYQLTDGDGDTSTATLTITSPQVNTPPDVRGSEVSVSEEGLVGGNTDTTGTPDTTDSRTASSSIFVHDADGDALTVTLGVPTGTFASGGETITWALSNGGQTLTGSAHGNTIITVTIHNDGTYDVALSGPVDHAPDAGEQALGITVPVSVSDGIATVPTTIGISIEDDSPVVNPVVNAEATVTLDETGPAAASTISTGAIAKGDDPDVSGSGAISTATSGSAIVDANVAFGGDGPAASDSLTYALSITGASPGLTTTDGSAINLVMENGVIVGVVSGGAFNGEAAFAISINPATGVVTVEQYLSLDHPITTDPNDALHMLTGSVGVTVTATDADQDSVTSGAVDVSNQITFLDDGPSVAPTLNADATVTLDETGPAAASTISTGLVAKGDDPDVAGSGAISKATSGSAVVDGHAAFGADGPAVSGSLTYALDITNATSGLSTTDGHAISLEMQNGVIVGVVQGGAFDGEAAFAISVDPATGVVTVEQYLSLDHPISTDPNDALHMLTGSVGVTVTATDGDGDHVTSGAVDISGQITFLDDGPSVAPTVHADATVTLDETGPAAASTISTGLVAKGDDPDVAGSGAISKATSGSAVVDAHAAFGADGPAITGSLTYALDITNATSGLSTTDDHAISLEMQNGVIVGVVQGGAFDGEAAFAISVDPATGVVTVEQYLSLDHPISTDPNDALHMLTGSVGVTVTATDGDGDHVTSGAVDISGQITFLDDGPSVAPTVHADATMTLDETGPTTATTIVTGVTNGDDPDVAGSGAISKATSGVAVVDAHAAFGADGPAVSGSLTYALSIESASSGLKATDGSSINLEMHNGVIVGVVSGGAFNGEAAFAISINSATGVVTVEQYLSLDHPIATDPNDALQMLTGSVGVTVTATDGDGDSVTSGAVDISHQITFLDDGPAAHPDSNTINEGGTVTGNVETNDLFGADGKDTGGGVVGVEAGTHLSDVVITGVGSPIAGTWGTLTLNADGSYSYHANSNTNPPPGSTDVFTYTIKDGDGDPSTTTLTIHVNDVTAAVGSATTIVSEEVLPVVGTEIGGDNDSDPANDVLVNSGNITLTDSLGGATFTTALTAPSGTYTSGGTTIVWTPSNGGHTMTGTAGGTTIVVATIDNTGHYTVTLSGPIDTPNGVNSGENGGDSIVVFGVTATDNLGNTLTPGTLTVHVEDDAPTIDVTKTADSGINLTTDDADTIGTNTDHASSTANFGGVFGLNFATGADGTNTTPTLAYTLGVSSSGVDSGLDSHGSSIFLYVIGGVVVGSTAGSIGAVTAGNTIFDVSVNSSGQVTLDQFQQIDHPIASDPTPSGTPFNDQSISLADGLITLTASSSITDKDGDTASDSETVNIGANLHFTDDGPHAATSGTAVGTVTLDETRPEGTDTPGGAAPSGDASATIDFSANFVTGASVNYGADGPGSVGYSLHLNGSNVASGLYALDNTDLSTADGDGFGQGGQIVLNQSGNTITGSFNGVNYFTIAIDPSTGVATFTELHNIWNPTAGSSAAALDEIALLHTALGSDIQVVQTVTDFDGDTSTASINVGQNVFGIEDDGPTVSATLNSGSTVSVDESGPGAAATIGLGGHTAGNDEDVTGSGPLSHAVSGSAVINSTIAYGTDGPSANQPVYGLTVTNANSGLMTTEDESISLVQINSTTILGIVAAGGEHANQVAFAIQIGADGKVTVDQYLSLDHPINPDPNDVLHLGANTIAATVSATDADGDTVSSSPVDISGQISFLDDGPTLGAFTDATIVNAVGHVDGTYAFDWGADGFGGFSSVTGPAIPGITYTSTTDADGGVTLHGNSGATPVFTLDVHPDGTYTFDLITPDAGSTTTQSLLGLKSGNSEFIQTDDGLVEMTPTDHNGTDTGTVNSSTVGFGNGNQFTGNGEAITFEFHSTNQAGDQTADTNPNFVSSVTLTCPSNGFNGSTETITWFATNTETHETATGTIQVDTNTGQLVITPGFTFNELTIEGSNADGNGIRLTQISETTTILPQSEDLTFNVQAKDGDGDPTGTSSFTVHVTVDNQSQAAVQQTQLFSQTALNTSSLVSSNDNDHERNAGTHNAVMMGALAAAGLSALDAGLGNHASFRDFGQGQLDHQSFHTGSLGSLGTDSVSLAQTSHVAQAAVVSHTPVEPQHTGTSAHDMVEAAHTLTAGDAKGAQANTELLQGTSAPAHAGGSATAVTAAAVTMPSAEQLAAAAHGAPGQTSVAGDLAQHEQVVGKVLADALHGGGHAPNVDALLSALGTHAGAAGGNAGLEALASHGPSAVPFMHMAGAGLFGGLHSVLSVEMAMHQDAPPPAHG